MKSWKFGRLKIVLWKSKIKHYSAWRSNKDFGINFYRFTIGWIKNAKETRN